MNVSGIDPSLAACGLARLEGGRPVTATVKTTPQGDDLRALSGRIDFVLGRALEWLPADGLFVIESPAPRQVNGLAAERHALYYDLVRVLLRRGVVVAVRPSARALYATGKGNAPKTAVLAAVRESFPGVRVSNDNAADALALLAMGSRNLGRPLEVEPICKTPADAKLRAKQLAAGDSLPWPTEKDI